MSEKDEENKIIQARTNRFKGYEYIHIWTDECKKIEELKMTTPGPKVMKKFMDKYEKMIMERSFTSNDYKRDSIYGNFNAEIAPVKIKQKIILKNERIDIVLAIKQLNEYQKELKNRADLTLSRSEQQKCFEDIENSKKLQVRLNNVINKLCELER